MSSDQKADGIEAAAPRLVPLSVPEELYEDVIEFIAARLRAKRKGTTRSAPRARKDKVAKSEHEIWKTKQLVDLLESNDNLRDALIAIARNGEMRADELAEAAGVEPGRAWGGFMSRAVTRAKRAYGRRELPMYPDSWDDHQYIYKIHEADANVIREWATKHGH